jgi:hypothetical protein
MVLPIRGDLAPSRLIAIIDPADSMLAVEGISFFSDNVPFVTQSALDAGVTRLKGRRMRRNKRNEVR